MIPLRLARELTYQLEHAHEHERLARALACVPVFLVLWKGEDQSGVLTLWQQLAVKGHEPEKYYTMLTPYLDFLTYAAALFESRGSYDRSMEFASVLLAAAEASQNYKRLANAHRSLGWTLWQRGEYVEAMRHSNESLIHARVAGDRLGEATAIGNVGSVHRAQGRYAEAVECYAREQAIAEELGNKRGLSSAIGNTGLVHMQQGRYAEALACYARQQAIAEELGNKRELSLAIGNAGNVHHKQGRYAEALACFARHQAITEELGDKRGLSLAIGNAGIIHFEEGRYAMAFACYARQQAIAEELGNNHGLYIAIGNAGDIRREQGRYVEALAAFRQALEGHREIGFRYGMTYWLEGIAATLLENVELALPCIEELEQAKASSALLEARENAEEGLRISEELSKPDTIYLGRVLLARIDAAEGNVALATEKLEAILAETTDEEQIAELHYWLWKINPDSGTRSPEPVLAMYVKLYSGIPKFQFVKRIAELKGERVPRSADEIPPPFQGGGQGVVA
jgi:tetratricopeptide (TPR) repeat protein